MAKTRSSGVLKAGASERPLKVDLTMRVKTYDIDFIGHVNNIVYVRWLEDVRLFFLDTYLPLEPLQAEGIVPVIVSTDIRYLKAVFLADRHVTVSMWLTEVGAAIFHLAAEFVVDGEVCCTATHRATFIASANNRPVRIPATLRETFAEALGA